MALKFNDEQESSGELHEINVTPFIDVILVLLITFMVAAPLATVDVKVELPAASGDTTARPQKPIYLSVDANKQFFIDDKPVVLTNLLAVLEQLTAGDKTLTLFFRADKSIDYATVMSVLDMLRTAGYTKIGLVGLATPVHDRR